MRTGALSYWSAVSPIGDQPANESGPFAEMC